MPDFKKLKLIGDCHYGWEKLGYTCVKYIGEKDYFLKALKKCYDLAEGHDIPQRYTEDISNLFSPFKLRYLANGNGPLDYFHHTVQLNLVKLNGKWYTVTRLPHDHHGDLHWEDLIIGTHLEEVTEYDFQAHNYPDLYAAGTEKSILVFDPHQGLAKVEDHTKEYPYLCSHKPEDKHGQPCQGEFRECNDRGECLVGKCYCVPGYSGDKCTSLSPIK